MVTANLPFADTIVKASELRSKQKYWLDKAIHSPLTITNGNSSLTILNRKTISNIVQQQYYSRIALQYCSDILQQEKSHIFTWLSYLDKKEQNQFHKDFIRSILKAIKTDNWDEVKEFLEDWQATAEVEHNPKIMKALSTKKKRSEYIPLE